VLVVAAAGHDRPVWMELTRTSGRAAGDLQWAVTGMALG